MEFITVFGDEKIPMAVPLSRVAYVQFKRETGAGEAKTPLLYIKLVEGAGYTSVEVRGKEAETVWEAIQKNTINK